MKLEEAIEILSECLEVGTQEATPDVNDAIRLGIAAFKRLEVLRKRRHPIALALLPGETEE